MKEFLKAFFYKRIKIQEIFTFKFLANKSKFWKFCNSSDFKNLYLHPSYFKGITHHCKKTRSLVDY